MIQINIKDKELEKRLKETAYIHDISIEELIKDSIYFFDIVLHKIVKGEEIISYNSINDEHKVFEYKKYLEKEKENGNES